MNFQGADDSELRFDEYVEEIVLPQAWAEDERRRHKARVPPEIKFKTKQQIALDQVRWAAKRDFRAASC